MQRIGVLLATLAAAKIGTIEYLQRGATRDALVSAYGKDAVAACQRAARAETTRIETLKPGPLWGASNSVRIEVGNRQAAVSLWQVDHQDWQARYRRTYLVLDSNMARCHYDVASGAATIADL